jgi:hypothetical protein
VWCRHALSWTCSTFITKGRLLITWRTRMKFKSSSGSETSLSTSWAMILWGPGYGHFLILSCSHVSRMKCCGSSGQSLMTYKMISCRCKLIAKRCKLGIMESTLLSKKTQALFRKWRRSLRLRSDGCSISLGPLASSFQALRKGKATIWWSSMWAKAAATSRLTLGRSSHKLTLNCQSNPCPRSKIK